MRDTTEQPEGPGTFKALLARFDALRAKVRGKVSVKDLIEEGRRGPDTPT